MKYGRFVEVNEGKALQEIHFLARATEAAFYARDFCQVVKIEESEGEYRGIATDGKRLHLVDPLDPTLIERFNLEPGCWKVIKVLKSRVYLTRLPSGKVSYPEWGNAIPQGTPVGALEYHGIDLKTKESRLDSKRLWKFIRGFPMGNGVCLEHLSDLGVGDDWSVAVYESHGGVAKFSAGNRTAVIVTTPLEDV